MRSPTSKPTRNEKGAVLLWTVFFLIVMLGCVAIGIDVAKVMTTRSQLQNAADAAALAGASAVNPETGELVPGIAKFRAFQTGLSNKAFTAGKDSVVVDTVNDVDVDLAENTVWVKVRREAGLGTGIVPYFSQVLGTTLYDVSAQATAQVLYTNEVCRNLVPLAVVPDTAAPYIAGCAYEYRIKYGAQDGLTGAYGPVRFPPCTNGDCEGMSPSGANTYRCLVGNGYGCCIRLDQCLDPETGNMSGPTQQAITNRFNRDTDGRVGICYEQYAGNGARVIYVPLTTPKSGPGGSGCYTVKAFGVFFIKNIPGSGPSSFITAQYISAIVPGNGDPNPIPGGSSLTLHLIR